MQGKFNILLPKKKKKGTESGKNNKLQLVSSILNNRVSYHLFKRLPVFSNEKREKKLLLYTCTFIHERYAHK